MWHFHYKMNDFFLHNYIFQIYSFFHNHLLLQVPSQSDDILTHSLSEISDSGIFSLDTNLSSRTVNLLSAVNWFELWIVWGLTLLFLQEKQVHFSHRY